ncbi:MAG TPA: LptA/OstA family protein [Xanthobacteraceae bacterium]|nr:LptA/OstA family protein [Xanthobacteraceae bacterium]
MTIIAMPRGGGLVAVTVATILGMTAVHAQQPGSSSNAPPNALQGFSQNRDKPIKINSATLEVRDKEKMATFAGDVHLVQGDTSMRSKTLVVYYDDEAPTKPGAPSAGATQGGPQQNQQIKRVEAKGNVIVVQKDQRATGESGIFDMRANTVTLSGNVLISQGPNVVKGDALTVDMTTGVSHITGAPGVRVQGLFQPGSMKQEGRAQEAAPAPTRETPRQRSLQSKGLSPQGLY